MLFWLVHIGTAQLNSDARDTSSHSLVVDWSSTKRPADCTDVMTGRNGPRLAKKGSSLSLSPKKENPGMLAACPCTPTFKRQATESVLYKAGWKRTSSTGHAGQGRTSCWQLTGCIFLNGLALLTVHRDKAPPLLVEGLVGVGATTRGDPTGVVVVGAAVVVFVPLIVSEQPSVTEYINCYKIYELYNIIYM